MMGLHLALLRELLKVQNELNIETARNFLSMNLSLEQIAQGIGLSLETVEQLAKEQESQN